MSKVQILRSLLKQRLPADDEEEIFELFERTIAEYEEELCLLKEEIERQRKLLEAVLNPEVRLHKDDLQRLSVVKEEVPPEHQTWECSLDQADRELPYIKEEEEELLTSQEQDLHESDVIDSIKFLFTPIPVKHENDDGNYQSSQLHQCQTENNKDLYPHACSSVEQIKMKDGIDSEESEPATTSAIDSHLPPHIDVMISQSAESETEDSDDDWKESRESQSGLMFLKNQKIPLNNSRCNDGPKKFTCLECGQSLCRKDRLKAHMRIHTGEKPYSCSKCGHRFRLRGDMKSHMRIHTGEKPFSCSVCGQRSGRQSDLKKHMRTHTGEKPFDCSECGKRFGRKGNLNEHMKIHTGEKPFSCCECGQRFGRKHNLKEHEKIHTGERGFVCSECGQKFSQRATLNKHMIVHKGEKPISCSHCGQWFRLLCNLKKHLRVHTGEKPFSCSECGQSFGRKDALRAHRRSHEENNLLCLF